MSTEEKKLMVTIRGLQARIRVLEKDGVNQREEIKTLRAALEKQRRVAEYLRDVATAEEKQAKIEKNRFARTEKIVIAQPKVPHSRNPNTLFDRTFDWKKSLRASNAPEPRPRWR